MAGVWAFKDTKSFAYYILAIIFIVGSPAAILILFIPKYIGSAAVGFVLRVIGVTWAGFGLIYPISLVASKFNLIKYHPND